MLNKSMLLVLLLMFVYTLFVLNIQKTSQELIQFYYEEILKNDEGVSDILQSYAECSEKAYIMLKNKNFTNKVTKISKDKQTKIYILSWFFLFLLAILFTFVIQKIILKNRK